MNPDSSTDLSGAFEDATFERAIAYLASTFGEERADSRLLEWRHGESILAIEALLNSVLTTELPLSKEIQGYIARLAEDNDQFQDRKWQQYTKEMTPEQLEKYEIKQPTTSWLAAFREVYPKQDS